MSQSRDIRHRAGPLAPTVDQPPPLRRPIAIGAAKWRELRAINALQQEAFASRLAYGYGTLITLKLLPNVRFLVARQPDGGLAGCGIGDRHDGQSRVINLAVAASARRQGVGAALLAALEDALPRGDMLLMVQEENDAARALYRRTGYREVGRAQHYYGPNRTGIWMQKDRPDAGGSGNPKLWV